MLFYLKKPFRALRNFIISLKEEYAFHVPGHSAKVLLSGRDFIYDKNPYHEIFYEGIYKTDYRGAIVLDIGAHKGYFTIYALLNGADKVFSYEPDDLNFKFLEKNIELNDFSSRVLLFHKAVCKETCERDFFIMQSSASHSLVERGDRRIVKKVRVPGISVNDVLTRIRGEGQERKKIILKLDVEGGEYEIIPAIENKYFAMIDTFFVEYHDVQGQSQKSMNDYILAKGFRMERTISDREYVFSRI